MYRLLFQNGGVPRAPIETDRSPVVIGRQSDCHVCLPEPGVRDRHAAIERRLDGYYLRALAGANGVSVNGQAVMEQRLSSGDELEIGSVRLRFEVLHGGGTRERRRPIDLSQALAALIVGLVIAGEVALLARVFSEHRPNKVKLDVARAPTDQASPSPSAPTFSGAAASAPADHPAPVLREPPLLNRMIRIARLERSDNGDVASVVIQAKAQAGERDLNVPAVAICVQFANLNGAGQGAGWRDPVWLSIPPWENFSSKTFTVRYPGPARDLVGVVVRTYYHRTMQDVAAVPPSLRTSAPIPSPEGSP
ncbi:MAG TPA: FHA domain-containing protein [Verrucomicrobiae bacterium]|nr:FHA domain-containing protein [Verrucomicrobiae bacterium]